MSVLLRTARPAVMGTGLVLACVVASACAGGGEDAPDPAAPCSSERLGDILEPATAAASSVVVDCGLSLPPSTVVTKQLLLQGTSGSGVTIDCHGSRIDESLRTSLSEENKRQDMVLIRSIREDGVWRRPTDVRVQNCAVVGSVRVLGMARTDELVESSRAGGHVKRMRRISPTRVTFDHVDITGRARIPLYVGAGVTQFSLLGSSLGGRSDAVAIYLDAESSQALIKRNDIYVRTEREVMAVDSSDHNSILDNRFSGLSHGGIYLYRNCGERGVIRHTTPQFNHIVNNTFYYKDYNPTVYNVRPSVFFGSRNGSPGYCDQDDGYPVGSSLSDLDYASHNVVAQNQIYELSPDLMIKEGSGTDTPNYTALNTTVTTPVERQAGCYVSDGFPHPFVLDGESISAVRLPTGEIVSVPSRTCHDGSLST